MSIDKIVQGAYADSSEILPTVAVVLISKDEASLATSLSLLYPQIKELGGECIVIDASEKRLDYIRLDFPWVRWIDYTAPLGVNVTIPHQRNVGVRAARADIIAFCDSGGTPSDNWLKDLVQPIMNLQYEVTCGPVESTKASVYKIINDFPDGQVVDTVLTANLAFSRRAFEAVSGFDERYQYGSDADFAWRLISAGFPPISINSALMGMNWGDWKLQKRRSWRYGKARSRLFTLHPSRRLRILNRSPEVIVYPTLIFLLFSSLVLAALLGIYYYISIPFIGFILLYLKNFKTGKPLSVIIDHIIYSTSFFVELLISSLRRFIISRGYVAHLPKDMGPYQPYLMKGLESVGVESGYLPYPTASKTLNLILLPATILYLAISGVKILHIHWVHDFDLRWSKGLLSGNLLYFWFKVFLRWSKFLGLSIVWTAHNILPHNKIFLDDVKARKKLIAYSDGIITHTEESSNELRERFGASNISVIAQGSTPPPNIRDPKASRKALGWPEDEIIFVILGRVEPYKGIVSFLIELEHRVEKGLDNSLQEVIFVIAGLCSNNELKNSITEIVDRLKIAGVLVTFDEGSISEAKYWDYLHGADYALFPFDSITNSGSLVAALSAGTPSLVTDLPAFFEIESPAIIKAGPEISTYFESLLQLIDLPKSERAGLSREALKWASGRSWDSVGNLTAKVYREILDRGKLS